MCRSPSYKDSPVPKRRRVITEEEELETISVSQTKTWEIKILADGMGQSHSEGRLWQGSHGRQIVFMLLCD